MKNSIRTLVLAVAALALAGASHAATCGTGATAAGTLASYISAGSCTLTSSNGITLTFSNFIFTPGPGSPTASQIAVSPSGGTLAFTFVAGWAVSSPNLQDADLDFTASASAPVIDDVTAQLVAFHCTGGGLDDLSENVYQGSTTSGALLGSIDVGGCEAGVTSGPATANFTPQTTVTIAKDLTVSAIAGGSASVSNFTDAVSVVPEPGSLMLLGSGLIGLAGALRRKLVK